MALNGISIGFIGVISMLIAAIIMAFLDKSEKAKGNTEKSKFLAKTALILFILAFIGGVAVTLSRGLQPRREAEMSSPPESPNPSMTNEMGGGPMTPPPMAKIGKIDPKEIEGLKKKVEKDPKDIKSRERLGHIYLQQQDFENVFKMSKEVLDINPHSVESRVHLAMVLFAMQDIDQALEQMNVALQMEPKNLEALLFKGIILFQGKQDLLAAKEPWDTFMKYAKPTDTGYDRVTMFLKMINEQIGKK